MSTNQILAECSAWRGRAERAEQKLEAVKDQRSHDEIDHANNKAVIKSLQKELEAVKAETAVINEIKDIINCTQYAGIKYKKIKELLKEGE